MIYSAIKGAKNFCMIEDREALESGGFSFARVVNETFLFYS